MFGAIPVPIGKTNGITVIFFCIKKTKRLSLIVTFKAHIC